jgi:hypothetical protein
MDINHTASHLSSAAGKLAPLAERIMKRADVNRDGSVTSEEFSDFLSKLSASLAAEIPAAKSHQASSPAAPAVPPMPLPSGTISASAAAMLRLVADNLPKDR